MSLWAFYMLKICIFSSTRLELVPFGAAAECLDEPP